MSSPITNSIYVGGGGGYPLGQAIGGNGGSIGSSQLSQTALQQQYQQYQQAINASVSVSSQPFDKDNEAWNASISTLTDLWLAKHGDEWVPEDAIIGDKFFAVAATRLLRLQRLEKFNVPTSMSAVYRIVE